MIAALDNVRDSTRCELEWFVDQCQLRPVRSLRDFAESELRIPDGPHEGKRFRVYRQPEVGVWFDLVDEGISTRRWNRFAATGPQQSGKTFSKWLCPLLWALFEWQENCIVFGPTEDILSDKWKLDIKPAIAASNFADLLPRRGDGSRDGGFPNLVQFQNGVNLKFMSGGGGDKKRSAFTARWVFGTEVDGMDESGESSRESSKVDQIEGRTRAYDENKLVFMECTVSIPQGRIWQEVCNGTNTRLMLPCPYCGNRVCLEREHFTGWDTAETELEAERSGRFSCYECHAQWTDDDREQANTDAVALHAGQAIDKRGRVTGPLPETRTLGFRYSAVNNLFVASSSIANQEWKARRVADQENADKALKQWVWSVPWEPDTDGIVPLEMKALMQRQGELSRGHVKSLGSIITVGCDVRKTQLHWLAAEWTETDGGVSGSVIDYDVEPVESDLMEFLPALMAAVQRLNDQFQHGWIGTNPESGQTVMKSADLCLIDSGWEDESVYESVEHLQSWMPSKGFGHAQLAGTKYRKPLRPGRYKPVIGDAWNIAVLKGTRVVEISTDAWKSRTVNGLQCDMASPHALTLFRSEDLAAHRTLARHLTAEKETFDFNAKRGAVRKWVTVSKQNHFFDAFYMARVAFDVSLSLKERRKKAKAQTEQVRARNQRKPGDQGGGTADKQGRSSHRRLDIRRMDFRR